MEQITAPQKSKERQTVTLQQVLRAHALGELQNYDAADLREFKHIISAKILEVQSLIKSTNQFYSRIIELRSDVRWYVMAELEIDSLLARQFHAR